MMNAMKSDKLGLEYEVLAEKILLFPNACPDPVASIAWMEAKDDSAWYENASEWNDLLGGPARHDNFIDFPSQEEADVVTEVFRTFAKLYDEVLTDIPESGYKQSDEQYNGVRYRLGGDAKNHVDQPNDDDIGMLNICIYLNDDYVGGELGFVQEQERKVNNTTPDPTKDLMYYPKAGDMVVFPGHFWHYAMPTVSGTKYLTLVKTFVAREGMEPGVPMDSYTDEYPNSER